MTRTATRRQFLKQAAIAVLAFRVSVPASNTISDASSYGTGSYGVATYQRRKPRKRTTFALGA